MQLKNHADIQTHCIYNLVPQYLSNDKEPYSRQPYSPINPYLFPNPADRYTAAAGAEYAVRQA